MPPAVRPTRSADHRVCTANAGRWGVRKTRGAFGD
jgi:hypothetical protein